MLVLNADQNSLRLKTAAVVESFGEAPWQPRRSMMQEKQAVFRNGSAPVFLRRRLHERRKKFKIQRSLESSCLDSKSPALWKRNFSPGHHGRQHRRKSSESACSCGRSKRCSSTMGCRRRARTLALACPHTSISEMQSTGNRER